MMTPVVDILILGVPTQCAAIGMDHTYDVARGEHILRTDPVQRALYEQIAKGGL